jgi:hypothetical protein
MKRIELLGRFIVRHRDGAQFPDNWPRALSKRLVRFLALHHPSWVPLDHIYTELWAQDAHDLAPEQRAKLRDRLYVLVHAANRFLQSDEHITATAQVTVSKLTRKRVRPAVERSSEHGLRLDATLITVDLAELRELIAAGDIEAARKHYRTRLLFEEPELSASFLEAREHIERVLSSASPTTPSSPATPSIVNAVIASNTPQEWEASIPIAHRVHALVNETFGREQDIKRIVELLNAPAIRWVTVIGLGGLGKSRVAIEAINRHSADSGQRCVFIDCRLASSTAALLESSLYALTGSSRNDIPNVFDALVTAVDNRQAVLLLDAFEHIADPDTGGVLTRLLQLCPRLKLLLTSRVAISESAEHRVHLLPMELPSVETPLKGDALQRLPAVALYLSHRRSAGDLRALTETHKRELIEVLQSSGGFPLAIEMLARWRHDPHGTPPHTAASSSRLRLSSNALLASAALSMTVNLSPAIIDVVSYACARASTGANEVFTAMGSSCFAMSASMLSALVDTDVNDIVAALAELEGLSLIYRSNIEEESLNAEPWYEMLDSVASVARAMLEALPGARMLEQKLFDYLQSLLPEGSMAAPEGSVMALYWRRYEPHVLSLTQRAFERGNHASAIKLITCFAPAWLGVGQWRKMHHALGSAIHQTALQGTEDDYSLLARARLLQADSTKTHSFTSVADELRNIALDAKRLNANVARQFALGAHAGYCIEMGQISSALGSLRDSLDLPCPPALASRRHNAVSLLPMIELMHGEASACKMHLTEIEVTKVDKHHFMTTSHLSLTQALIARYEGDYARSIAISENSIAIFFKQSRPSFAESFATTGCLTSVMCLNAEILLQFCAAMRRFSAS